MARKVNSISPFNITALALGMAFLYLPIVILVIYSFNDSRLVTVWGGWSLRWYYEFFNDRAMLDAAWMSLRVAAYRPRSRRCSARWRRWGWSAASASGAVRCFPACSMRRW
jgi:ABC-type spermidine/putrescine transport system permease subunit I